MATLTSHTLNGSDGTHAGGIPVTLTNLNSGAVVLTTAMDGGGREGGVRPIRTRLR